METGTSHGQDDYYDDYAGPQSSRRSQDDALDALDDYAPAYDAPIGNAQQPVDELAVLDAYASAQREPTASNLDEAVDSLTEVETEDNGEVQSAPVFTASNPTGTVSVSAFIGGGIYNVELSADATKMAAAELAMEIVLLADLARHKGASAQHESILEQFNEADPEDTAIMSQWLSQELNMSTPEQAAAAEAHLLATRYAHNND